MSSQCFVFNFFLLFLFSFIGFGCFHCCLVVVFGWDFFFSKTDILDTSIFRKILLMMNTFLYFYFFFLFFSFPVTKISTSDIFTLKVISKCIWAILQVSFSQCCFLPLLIQGSLPDITFSFF